jgi:hypothetical protein
MYYFRQLKNSDLFFLPGRVLQTILGLDCISLVALVGNIAYVILRPFAAFLIANIVKLELINFI